MLFAWFSQRSPGLVTVNVAGDTEASDAPKRAMMNRISWAGTTMFCVLCWTVAAQWSALADGGVDAPQATARADTINLSRDLVRLGIATSNLPPDSPSTDARPLFEAALQYAAIHPIGRITVDHGAYYFLTPQDAGAYLRLTRLSDLTVDLADSTVFFASAVLQGFAVVNCEHVTLTRFRADFISPPYTHVGLTAVDPVARRLSYALLPNWPDPVEFNGLAQSTAPTSPLGFWALDFRNGDILPGTSRMEVTQPIAAGALDLVQSNAPWVQGTTLSTFQPGDTIVVFVRGGQATISVVGGDSITVSDATIYGSSLQGIQFNSSSNGIVERVRVMPRPGSLISVDAGGIIFVDDAGANHIRNNLVARNLDDALAIYETDAATVVQQIAPNQLVVDRVAFRRFPNGTKVNFVDPATGNELGGATIVAQQPSDSTPPVFGGTVTLTFDTDLPTLAAGFGMVPATPASRGSGSRIENNVVGEVLFGRGVYGAGNIGLTVVGNKVGHTSFAGIEIFQNLKAVPLVEIATPPAHDVTIRNNVVHGSLGPMASGSGSQIAVAAIEVATTNPKNDFPASSPNTNIVIEHNTVLESGRSGIWVNEVSGGAIRENTINGWDQHPELPLNGVDPQTRALILQDSSQPLVTHNSQNLEVDGNVTVQKPAGGMQGN
jgi:hypothetical protein